MAWARLDDGFDDHPKVLSLLEHEQGAAAIGLWTLCLAWAHRNTRKRGKTPGDIPPHLPRRYLGPNASDLVGLLVKEELWETREEGGWHIHDFVLYLPSEEMSRSRAEAGRKGGLAKAENARLVQDGVATSQDGVATSQDGVASAWQTPSMAVGTTGSTSVKPPTPIPEVQNPRMPNRQNGQLPGLEVRKCEALTKNGRGPRCQHDARPGKNLCGTHDPEKPDDAPGFEDFWSVYPRKIGKDGARSTWRSKITTRGIPPERVIAAARRYAEDPARTPDFTAHPATWLNQGRYDDGPREADRLAW